MHFSGEIRKTPCYLPRKFGLSTTLLLSLVLSGIFLMHISQLEFRMNTSLKLNNCTSKGDHSGLKLFSSLLKVALLKRRNFLSCYAKVSSQTGAALKEHNLLP